MGGIASRDYYYTNTTVAAYTLAFSSGDKGISIGGDKRLRNGNGWAFVSG